MEARWYKISLDQIYIGDEVSKKIYIEENGLNILTKILTKKKVLILLVSGWNCRGFM